MNGEPKAHLRVSFHLSPSRRSLKFLQYFKLSPILVSEHYTLYLRLENLRVTPLKDVRGGIRLWIKIGGRSTPFKHVLEFGDLSAGDYRTCSWGPHLMRDQGSSDIDILWVRAGKESLTMEYQSHPSRTFLYTYDAEPWSAIVARLVGVITFLTLLLTILFRVFHM
jgi:hypothetical protein